MYSVPSKNDHLKVDFIVSVKVSIVPDIIFPAHDHWLTVSFPVICRSQVLPWAAKEKRNWRRRRKRRGRRQMTMMICLDLQGQWSSIRDGGDRNEEQKLAFEKFKHWDVDFYLLSMMSWWFHAMTEYSYHLDTLSLWKGPLGHAPYIALDSSGGGGQQFRYNSTKCLEAVEICDIVDYIHVAKQLFVVLSLEWSR